MPKVESVLMEGVRIVFRNFAGREGPYNREGERSFAVLLDDDVAKAMDRDGWNVKTLKPREDDEEQVGQPYITVSVSYKNRPPQIALVTSRGRTNLGEDEIEILDWADIDNVDLFLNPYEWVVNGKSGIKAYLQKMFVTIREDALDLKYADLDQIPSRSGRTDDRLSD